MKERNTERRKRRKEERQEEKRETEKIRRSWGEKKIGIKKRREEGEIVGITWERKMRKRDEKRRENGKGRGRERGGRGREGDLIKV